MSFNNKTFSPTSESADEEEDEVDFAESMFRAFKKGLYIFYLGGNVITNCPIPVIMPFEFGRR